MKLVDALLEHTSVYRLWQAPFADGKLAPVLAHGDVAAARRVLDVGCGPGTNTARFAHAEYVGIDLNPRYVASARRRYRREFVVADVCTYEFPPDRKFDLVLVNSFLHHVDDAQVRRVLAAVARTLAPGGRAHVLDLVLPEERSLARWLAVHDRGRHARPLAAWRALFADAFEVERFHPYPLALFGLTLWNMVYCVGKAKP